MSAREARRDAGCRELSEIRTDGGAVLVLQKGERNLGTESFTGSQNIDAILRLLLTTLCAERDNTRNYRESNVWRELKDQLG